MTVASGSILSDALLQACRARAAGYDRDNKFCQEDFDELKAAGYLKLTLPTEFGGLESLTILNLYANRLEAVPASIGSLTASRDQPGA